MLDQESNFSSESNLSEQLQGALLQIELNQEKLAHYEQENTWLREQLATLTRAQFGRKSERYETTEQMVFNEAEVESKQPDPKNDQESEEEIEVKAHTKKKRGHRRPLPGHLAREVVKIELPLDEQVASDGAKLKVIGWEISEKLKFEPSRTVVLEIHRAKYGVDSGDYEKTAPPTPAIIPKGIATPELLAAIIVSKYSDGMPLYRKSSTLPTFQIQK